MSSLDENAKALSDFGLTQNQAKVYIAIVKIGIAAVGQVSKASKVRREDVYRILPKLEKMGLIEKTLGTPVKVRAMPVEEALALLIEREKHNAAKKMSALIAKKDAFLKHFKAYRAEPTFEEAHFSLVSAREGVINKEVTLVRKAKKEIDIITSRDKFLEKFTSFSKPFKRAIRKGVKVRIVLDITEFDDLIQRTIEEYNSSRVSIEVKCTDQPLSHCIIRDFEEALVATSRGTIIGEAPYLWTNDSHLVGLMQKNFEGLWHTSVDLKKIECEGLNEKLTHFLKDLRTTSHTIFLYESLEAKHNVLFNYLKIGLENGEAAAYVTTEENPTEIKEAMKRFGIDAEKYEKAGALGIYSYNDVYIVNGKFNALTTINLWKKMLNEALTKGFTGLRVTGEMSCFFKYNMVQELIEYERSLHRILDIPIIAICAYNSKLLNQTRDPINLYTELVRSHGTVLFTGIDNKVGRIEIRRA